MNEVKDIDDLWRKEAEARVKEIQSGKVKPIAGDKVFQAVKEIFVDTVKQPEGRQSPWLQTTLPLF